MPFGMGPFGWGMGMYGYPYWGWRCRRFPWLPRWWWTGMYGPITPSTTAPGTPYTQYYASPYSTYAAPPTAMPSMMYPPYATSPYSTSMGIPQISKEQEKQMLEGQAAALQQQLDQIRKRLEELGKM